MSKDEGSIGSDCRAAGVVLRRTLLVGCSLAAISAGAAAQTPAPAPAKPADQTIESVVVTAQKRSERVQKVPISVTVVNAAQLQRQQIETVQDLSQASASLQFAPTTNSPGGGGTIRGVGTESFQAGAQPSVGIVLDGVALGNLNTNNLFDISRVEVLSGPQGMLFGSSTSAGVINITTNAPDPSHFYNIFHSDIGLNGVGSAFGNQIVNLVTNIPITPDSAVRISGFGNYLEGLYHDNYNGKDSSSADQGVRAHFLDRINDDLTLQIIGDYEHINEQGYDLFVADKGLPASEVSQLAACGGITEGQSNRKDCENYPSFSETYSQGISGQLDWNVLGDTVTEIASFRDTRLGPAPTEILGYGPQSAPALVEPSQNNYQRQVTEELRLASPSNQRWEYTVGFFYSNYGGWNLPAPLNITFPPLPFFPPFPILSGTQDHSTIESAALFGQTTFHVTPSLRLIAGGRLTHETVADTGVTISGPKPFPTILPIGGNVKVDNASWRLGIQYDVAPHDMLYFTATHGYKGPQVSDGIPGEFALIKPEIPTDLELGFKGSAFRDRLAVDVAGFHDIVKDFQGQKCVADPALECTPTNVPSVTTEGVEVNVFGKPIPALTLNSTLLYDRNFYPRNYKGSDGTDLAGATLENGLTFKFTNSAEYTWTLANESHIFADLNTVYKSDLRLYPSASSDYVFPAHWTVGAKIGYRSPGNAYGIALFVRNLTNSHEPVQIYANNPGAVYILGPQTFRLVGITLDARF
jgi:iron complex outermembrane receptor protein